MYEKSDKPGPWSWSNVTFHLFTNLVLLPISLLLKDFITDYILVRLGFFPRLYPEMRGARSIALSAGQPAGGSVAPDTPPVLPPIDDGGPWTETSFPDTEGYFANNERS